MQVATLDGIEARVDALENRVDGMELEIGRTTDEGLRSSIHRHGNLIQRLLISEERYKKIEEKQEAMALELNTIKAWGRVALIIIPPVMLVIQHYWK